MNDEQSVNAQSVTPSTESSVGLAEVRRAARALRQPLSLIIGPTQLLLEETAPGDPHYDELMVIARNCEVLIKGVDELYSAVRSASKASVGFRQTGHLLARNLSELVRTPGNIRRRTTGANSHRFHILVVDDSPDTRLLVSAVLGPFANVACVASGDEALQTLRGKTRFDVVVSDVMMPGMGGDELARIIRRDPDLLDVGIILLTGRSDPAFRAAVIHETVDDYLVKPFDTNELTARTLRLARDARSRATLRRRALTDELTTLPNRSALVERMEHVTNLGHQNFSVVMLDIDHFKQVNDTWGHGVGDEVLRQFANVLTDSMSSKQVAGRFGGEEFVVLLPDVQHEEAVYIGQTLIRRITDTVMMTTVGPLAVSASAGVATLREADTDWMKLLARADLRLYRAKDSGRNRVCGSEQCCTPEALSTVID